MIPKLIDDTERTIGGYQKECFEVEQNLGIALGYPRYMDDQKNFPGATEDDGVCIGDHTPASIAMEAAQRITKLQAEVLELKEKSVSKEEHDELASKLFDARRAQISIFDMDYPPRAVQGGLEENGSLNLVTAEDVNRWLSKIQELTLQVVDLQTRVVKGNIYRDGEFAKAKAIEKSCMEYYAETKQDKRILEQHVDTRERVAERCLTMIINSRRRPITDAEIQLAARLLTQMIPPTCAQENIVRAGMPTQFDGNNLRLNITEDPFIRRRDE